MYRLVLYYLVFLFLSAFGLGIFHLVPYNSLLMVASLAFILAVSFITNVIFAKVFGAPANVESVYITAFIIFFLITPAKTFHDMAFLRIALWASAWAMASKFILAINKKHIFNPAAIGVAMTLIGLDLSASWWVGTGAMLPFVLIGGLLLVRKVNRFDLVWSFFATALVLIFLPHLSSFSAVATTFGKVFLDTPIVFFAFVMLTEPLTTPPGKFLRILYGILVGILYSPQFHIGSLYLTPELALICGNIFSYAVSPKQKLVLTFKEKSKVTPDIYDFIFENKRAFHFQPGQYMEWTLPALGADSRGNRRYFTIASSPTEAHMRLGVKFYEQGSSFKKKLLALTPGETIVASELDGEFVLPKNKKEKLAFIAGGIGATPFRSMAKYLEDTNEKRDIVFLYSNRLFTDIAYKNIFDDASRRIGFKTIYALTEEKYAPAGNEYVLGRITDALIRKQIPDFMERTFYISGTEAMVRTMKDALALLGVQKRKIVTDFFPGFV
jgi:ferredoxin-NADP reductase